MTPSRRNGRARAVDAPQDVELARRLLRQADKHLASASIDGIDSDSKFGLLYDAARKAADATMRIAGRRVTQGAGHHVVFISEARKLLGPAHDALWTQVDAARSIRNDMEYRAREVSQSELDGFEDAATQVVAAARGYLAQADASADS